MRRPRGISYGRQFAIIEIEMVKNLVTAGGYRDSAEAVWTAEVAKPGQTFEALADSGDIRLRSLGRRLSTAPTLLIRNCPAGRPLREGLMAKEEMAQANSTVLRGRQTAILLYESFKTNMHMALVYSVTDLATLQCPGDARARIPEPLGPHYGFHVRHLGRQHPRHIAASEASKFT